MSDESWQKTNAILRIVMILIMLGLGASVWYVGLGPSAERVKLCYEQTGIPIDLKSLAHKEGSNLCISCYDLMKQEASKYVTNSTPIFIDNLKKLNVSALLT